MDLQLHFAPKIIKKLKGSGPLFPPEFGTCTRSEHFWSRGFHPKTEIHFPLEIDRALLNMLRHPRETRCPDIFQLSVESCSAWDPHHIQLLISGSIRNQLNYLTSLPEFSCTFRVVGISNSSNRVPNKFNEVPRSIALGPLNKATCARRSS